MLKSAKFSLLTRKKDESSAIRKIVNYLKVFYAVTRLLKKKKDY